MTGASAPPSGLGLYVYGVVRADTSDEVFRAARGVDPAYPVVLVRAGALAAVASAVSLDEFGAEPIAENLRVADWVAAKVRAHDDVLAAAVGETTVVPFRFGAIYAGEEPVVAMLGERADLQQQLDRLAGRVELGVKGFVDRDRFRAVLAEERGLGGDKPATGRAYMERRRLDRELDDEVRRLAAERAAESHERLAAAAEDARSSPPRSDEGAPAQSQMFLNAAYLVREGDVATFRAAVDELEEAHRADGIAYELTGPWPPYNFVVEEDAG